MTDAPLQGWVCCPPPPPSPPPPPPLPPSPPSPPRGWRVTALLLRVLCAVLLVAMFSVKVRDFLLEPVATSVRSEPAPLPHVTVCPGDLNHTAMLAEFDNWSQGRVTTDSLLDITALDLADVLQGCATRDSRSCEPRGAGAEFGWGRWRQVRYPPGFTCYTLQTRPVEGGNSEVKISLRLDNDIFGDDGFYRVFVHGEATTAKTYYGGGMVSAYFMVSESGDIELVLGLSETVLVDRRQSHCRADADYDQNQCLQDCRSRAAFLAANCSVWWGSPREPSVPSCATPLQYHRLRAEWGAVDPDCSCPQPCVRQEVTLTQQRAMTANIGNTINLQLRFPYRKQVLEERRSYLLVDLMNDLGGAMGLLLGYSLSSLVDVGDWIVTTLAAARGRR